MVGQQVSLKVTLDTGNTDVVRSYLYETDVNGTILGYYEVVYYAQTEIIHLTTQL